MSSPKKHIIFSTGGTGGHIFPALAVAQNFRKNNPDVEILFVGAKHRMEFTLVPQYGFPIIGLPIKGWNRSHLWKNIFLPYYLFLSFFIAWRIIKRNNSQLAIGFGGFASFCVLKVAQWLRIPTLIHEQNSFPGKSNKILSKSAKNICVAFEQMDKFFPKEKIILTGNPVREVLIKEITSKKEAATKLQLNPHLITVLVLGGSLGAESINQVIQEKIAFFNENNIQLIWQTGRQHYSKYEKLTDPTKNIFVLEFIEKMELYYSLSDIIISRAGAMSIAELCIVGKPVIFVPLPSAAENHQYKNAMALKEKEACEIVQNENLKMDLIIKIEHLIQNEELRKKLSSNISKLKHVDAVKNISEIITSTLQLKN